MKTKYTGNAAIFFYNRLTITLYFILTQWTEMEY